MQRHKVFISYHDGRDQPGGGDLEWRQKFEEMFADVIQCGAVQDDDIDRNEPVDEIRRRIRDDYLSESSVTVVLVGERTWQRKHVDWEISASIRDTKNSPRSGLLGIMLPSRSDYHTTEKIDAGTIPPRLYDNIKCGFAMLRWWTDDPEETQRLVREAYLQKSKENPDNSRVLFAKNRTGDRWTD